MELTAQFRKALGFETWSDLSIILPRHGRALSFNLITVAPNFWRSLIMWLTSPPNMKEVILRLTSRIHQSDILDYFREKSEVIESGTGITSNRISWIKWMPATGPPGR